MVVKGCKNKIFNDPVHGFISVPTALCFDIIEHPHFQRLRRIKQLGLTNLVYPGANHTRFQHAMGAMQLMCNALDTLKQKGVEISEKEYEGAAVAILLHDIGHGPFSHSLENSIVNGLGHEDIGKLFMNHFNVNFDGKLDIAIQIFNNKYEKKFLHTLVSGQLDVDRLDYLKRDSFFTGVQEGAIGSERIIKMLNVSDDGQLVVEQKGIYSVENFIVARKLMYWQVYHHKTVLAAEQMLINILKRAKELAGNGVDVNTVESLNYFINNNVSNEDFSNNGQLLQMYADIDDFDIMYAIKKWCKHSDRILSLLSHNLINRCLYKIKLQNDVFAPDYILKLKEIVKDKYELNDSTIEYFVFNRTTSTSTYSFNSNNGIQILKSDGEIADFVDFAGQLAVDVMSKPMTKHYICFPFYNS